MIEYTSNAIKQANGEFLKQSLAILSDLDTLSDLKAHRDVLPFALQFALDEHWNMAFFPLNLNMSPVGFAQAPELVDERSFIHPQGLDISNLPTDGYYNYWLYPMDEHGFLYTPWACRDNAEVYVETVSRVFQYYGLKDVAA